MNVSVEGNTVQVPFAVAAQVCGVDASVIAEKQESGDVACEIDQETAAQHNIGGGDQQQAEQEGGEEDGQAADNCPVLQITFTRFVVIIPTCCI